MILFEFVLDSPTKLSDLRTNIKWPMSLVLCQLKGASGPTIQITLGCSRGAGSWRISSTIPVATVQAQLYPLLLNVAEHERFPKFVSMVRAWSSRLHIPKHLPPDHMSSASNMVN